MEKITKGNYQIIRRYDVKKSDTSKIEIDLYYDIGGHSFITNQTNKRGFYVSVMPVEISEGWKKTTAFSGFKYFLGEEIKRVSKKAFERAEKELETKIDFLISSIEDKTGFQIIRD